MSCNCKNKNKDFHPCQNGGSCECGGKCKENNNDFLNAAGSLEDFKDEDKNIGKTILYTIGGLTFAGIGYYLFTRIKK